MNFSKIAASFLLYMKSSEVQAHNKNLATNTVKNLSNTEIHPQIVIHLHSNLYLLRPPASVPTFQS